MEFGSWLEVLESLKDADVSYFGSVSFWGCFRIVEQVGEWSVARKAYCSISKRHFILYVDLSDS